MSMRRHPCGAAAVLAGLAVLLAPAPAGAVGDAAAGGALARELCAGCHAVERGAASPVPDAPPFASFPAKWPVEHLQEALAEGIVVGSATAMPYGCPSTGSSRSRSTT